MSTEIGSLGQDVDDLHLMTSGDEGECDAEEENDESEDADGQRVRKGMLNTSNAPVWTVYEHFPLYERRMEGSTATLTKSYFFGGQRIGQKVGSDTFTYFHTDHLGSTVLTTGVAGDKKYTAYGAQQQRCLAHRPHLHRAGG